MRTSRSRRINAPTSDSLGTYIREIGAFPLLSRRAEAELGRRIRAGDASAVDTLVCSNLRFVVAIAKTYQHDGIALGDLISDGNIGLMRAARRFDETHGIRFISYAVWWVRQAIRDSLAQQSRVVRVPPGRVDAAYDIRRRASVLAQRLGRSPTNSEIATTLHVSKQQIDEAEQCSSGFLSLDAPAAADTDMRLLDYLADDAVEMPDESMVCDARGDAVERALTALRPRDASVLRQYFGLAGDEPATLEHIGRTMGVTRERARQIKDRALRRLRAGREGRLLAALAG